MTFLNLGALFGLAAIALPIAIHLLNRFQVRRMPWAAMRFLRESIERTQRRVQLEDLVLLLLRCLLVALLILVLSRPVMESGGLRVSGASRATAVIILDDSYSMGVTNGIQTRLQQAQAAAEQVLQALPSGSSSALFLAADNVQPVIALPTLDFNLLRETIRKTKVTDRSTDLSLALQEAIAMLQKKEGGSKEIYLITDGQAIGFPQLDQMEKQLADVQKEIAVHIVLVGGQAESNMAVSALRLDSGLTPVNQPLRCSITVLNGSETDARDVRVSLSMDGQPPIDQTLIDHIAAGASRTVSLFAKITAEGYHTITAKIPPDRLPADDQRTVAVHAIREVKVLLVEGTPSNQPSQADDFFVRNALVPVPATEADAYYIKTTSIAAAQLAGTNLDDYDAVFLLHVDSAESAQVTALTAYVNQGGGLVIFPGPHGNLDFYNQQLGSDGFLPAKLAPWKGDPEKKDQSFDLQTKDYDHPIATLWNDPSTGTLSTSHVYAYYPLTLTPWKAPAAGEPPPTSGLPREILHLTNGDPLAVEHTWGRGRVILFATTATTAWNDLPVHQAFVPLMYRTLGYLVERQDEGLNIAVGQKFSYAVSNDLMSKDVSVTAPGAEPPRVVGQVALVNGLPVVQYADTDEAGAYRVTIGADSNAPLYFAAQANSAESNLTPLSPSQLKSLGGVAQVLKWSPDISLAPKLTADRSGRELWIPLLWAALIVAITEIFVAHYFSQSK